MSLTEAEKFAAAKVVEEAANPKVVEETAAAIAATAAASVGEGEGGAYKYGSDLGRAFQPPRRPPRSNPIQTHRFLVSKLSPQSPPQRHHRCWCGGAVAIGLLLRHRVERPPPTPSLLRFSKFFQANMRILVTGGAGFIGSHLVDKLMENEKNEVIVADNFFTGSKGNLKKWIGHPRFELIRHDVTEPLLLEVDQIYHLACPASPIFYKHNPVKTIKTNVIGTLNMLGLAKRVGARILLTSTSEVYGDPLEHPQTEAYWGNVNPIGVRSCYDEGKRVAETLMFDYHRQHGIEIRIARIFNTYGPRMNIDDGRVVSNFIAQAIRGEALTVQKPGTQTRSFCYVADMVNGLMKLMSGDNTGPINIGNPGEFTMLELAENVKELINPEVTVTMTENTPDDPRQRKPDITKAKEVLDWEPKVVLRDGLVLMEDDFRERLAVPKKAKA